MDTICSGCSAKLATADVLYSSEGQPLCAACNAKVDLVDTDKRAAGNIVKAGWSGLGGGVAACGAQIALVGIITYFFIAIAVISGTYALNSLSAGNERFWKHLTPGQRTMVQVCAMIGFVLSALTLLGIPFRIVYGMILGG
ncbi:MAG: hypothetical protein JWO36_7061 [Myxococcales bacterium]|nr:hypothetical protein [Myxococcales bacterium]